jgi:hypothetical protein
MKKMYIVRAFLTRGSLFIHGFGNHPTYIFQTLHNLNKWALNYKMIGLYINRTVNIRLTILFHIIDNLKLNSDIHYIKENEIFIICKKYVIKNGLKQL